MTDQELKDLVASLAVSHKETEKLMLANKLEQKKTDEQIKQTSEQMKQTDEQLKRMGVTLGNIGRNNGAVAEDFFYSSLAKEKKLGTIVYDEIGREWKKDLKNMRGEYDIVLINGKEVAIVEVKYKVHPDDIDNLEKKLKSFPLLFSDYKNYNIKGAVASLSMSKAAEKKILQKGYFALKQKGNHIEVSSPQ